MKKLISILLLVSLTLTGCMVKESNDKFQSEIQGDPIEKNESIEESILSLVDSFGYKLQNVSLLGPKNELEKSMKENYGGLVSPELIEQWLKDPQNAPGRLTSSPWPDRIDVTEIEKVSDGKYVLFGEIVEVTSTQEIADRIPVHLLVEKVGERWLITDVRFEKTDSADQITYENDKYGFRFKLPVSWQGYSIIEDEWKGLTPNGEVSEKGPMISIRHPEWTAQEPRQDIPIMVFTIEQWDLMQSEKFHIGAAPIGPKELARNEKYVFALPARYNFAFPTGYEEVEEIMANDPIETSS